MGSEFEPATRRGMGKPRTRNLGSAILMAAIEDYRNSNKEAHENAERFLYPTTAEWREQYEWAVALADGVNPAWLRDALDRARGAWDRQRRGRKNVRIRPCGDGKEMSYGR